MLVSVVMPARNSEKTLAQSIESVLAQTCADWELLVVDNGSSDRTAAIVSEYAEKDRRVRLLSCGIPCAAAARRRGIDEARGEFVAFLDSDDLWLPEKLSAQLALGANFSFTGCAYINADGSHRDTVLHAPERVGYPEILKQNVIPCSSVLVRRALLEGCFTETTNELSEDFAAWIRILRRGAIAVGLDQPLLRYRLSANSLSGNKLRSAIRCFKMYRSVGLSVPQAMRWWLSYVARSVMKYSRL